MKDQLQESTKIKVFKMSAKTNEHVSEGFLYLAQQIQIENELNE
jgi:hypothetical protein